MQNIQITAGMSKVLNHKKQIHIQGENTEVASLSYLIIFLMKVVFKINIMLI